MMMCAMRYVCVIVSVYLGFSDAGGLREPLDLSWAIDEHSVFWPNTKTFNFTLRIAGDEERGYWYAMNEFCTGEHGGTHFDAPYHFSRDGMKVGDVPLNKLITQGVCIDLQSKTRQLGASSTLTPEDIIRWERAHGRIPKGSVVLINFGWGKYYGTQKYLYNPENTMNFPGITKEATETLVNRKVAGIGLDTASIDPGTSTDFQAHRILGNADIYVLENVNIPQNFPEKGFKLYVLPMKIREGTGAPVRIVAVSDHKSRPSKKDD